jgi:hypothetical protein
MGLSETILAAMIGAIATVTTALFQLFGALRARSKIDPRPRKGMTTMRSVLAVLALMVASAAGGFLYSELMKQRSGEDMRAMREELKDLRSLIAQRRSEPAAQAADESHGSGDLPPLQPPGITPATMEGMQDSVESVVYVPACRRSDVATACSEGDAQRIALCGTVPSYARIDGIELFVQPDAVQHPWDQHRAAFEQDLGGARFTGKSFEYAQGADLKAVCVNFMHWSSEHPHIARVVVQYGFGAVPAPSASEPPATSPAAQAPAVIAAEGLPAVSHPTSFAAPAVAQ